MQLTESIGLAVASVRSNKLRSALTLLSIAVGVFAIMGSTTVVDSLDAVFTEQISSIGANTFIVSRMPTFVMGPREWHKYAKRKDITYQQAQAVREQATLAKSASAFIQGSYTVRGGTETTDSPMSVIGADEKFMEIYDYAVKEGRGITYEDVFYKREYAVIGEDVVKRLFKGASPIGRLVMIKNKSFTVIGTIEPKGSVVGQSRDAVVIIPLTAHLKYFTSMWDNSLTMLIKAPSQMMVGETADQVIGIMRTARKVPPGDDNDFELTTNDALIDTFKGFTKYLVYFGVGVSSISLLAAGVGIMNIMLVSVKERTREIGVRKAVGATRANILTQFVIEAITLCQLGGLIGILLGIGGGNALALYLGTSPVFPWQGTLIAAGACTLIGLTFGAYPAWRAASLDPIDALRYE